MLLLLLRPAGRVSLLFVCYIISFVSGQIRGELNTRKGINELDRRRAVITDMTLTKYFFSCYRNIDTDSW